MWPLLKRDGLATQYIALTALWNWFSGTNPLRIRDNLTKYLSIVCVSLGDYGLFMLTRFCRPHIPALLCFTC
jgi:hypothetical protein